MVVRHYSEKFPYVSYVKGYCFCQWAILVRKFRMFRM